MNPLWNGFLMRTITRLLWPLLSVGMEVVFRFYISDTIVFPNQSILVLAFILPAAYISDFKNEVPVNLIAMLSLIGTVPFMSAIAIDKPIVYWSGFSLYVFYLLLFLSIDVTKTYQRIKEVTE